MDILVQPGGKCGLFRTTLGIIHLDVLRLHSQVGGLDDAAGKLCLGRGNGNLCFRSGRFYGQGLIIDFELVEVNFGQLQISGTVIPLEFNLIIVGIGKLFQGDAMLLLELGVEFVGVAVVQINQGDFGRSLIHLAQATAGGLKHHVLGAVTFLIENNAR